MKRKDYETPSMTVVELKHQCCILAGSGEGNGQNVGTQNYTTHDYYEE